MNEQIDEILSGLMKDSIANTRADDPPQGREMLLSEAKAKLQRLIVEARLDELGRTEFHWEELYDHDIGLYYKEIDTAKFEERVKQLTKELGDE